jgi:hypothetical protein
MNLLLANIYTTHGGLEKIAAEMPDGVTVDDLPGDLSTLALMIVSDDSDDITKTAAAHESTLGQLIEFDSAGRQIAQAEFSEMEKAASEGDTSALEAFFADADAAPETEQKAAVAESIKAELRRRGIQR